MKNFSLLSILVTSLVFSSVAAAQSTHSWLRFGDKAYDSKDFPVAEDSYRRALEKQNSTNGTYNLGNSIYKQERFDEAVKHYENAAGSAKDRLTKAKAYHNLGNAHFKKEQFDKSVEAYKNGLRLNPNDMQTKQNLALAIQRLQQQQQQQQQQNQQQDNKQQKPKDKRQQQQQQNQQQQQPQKSEQEQPQDLNKEEASKLLEIMDQEEQKVQEKLRKAQSRPPKSKKDW